MALLGILLMNFVFAQQSSVVKTLTPQGFVQKPQQVRIEFSAPMVKFGDLQLNFPAKSECFKEGQGRWVDTKNWVFDFKQPLPGGVSCSIEVLGRTYAFNTGGPGILQVLPESYRELDSEQNFLVFLDAPVKKSSVAEGAYFVVQGLGDRIPALLLSDSEANNLIQTVVPKVYGQEFLETMSKDYVALKSVRPFPSGAKVSLVWGRKIQAISGASSPEDFSIEYEVLKDFKAEFGCDREVAGGSCVPVLSMGLSFTAEILRKSAQEIYLEGPDKKKIFAKFSEGENISWVSFPGPFPPNTEYKIYLPKNLKDYRGRSLVNQAQFPLSVKTGRNPALLKFAGNFSLIEASPEAAIPVTLRRVENQLPSKFVGWTGLFKATEFKKILEVMAQVQQDPYGDKSLDFWKTTPSKKIQIQKPLKSTDTEVVGIPLKAPGFYAIEMESPLLGQSLLDRQASFYVRTAALVTNMAVHTKFNNKEAWVWVTDLKSTKVVPDALIHIFNAEGVELAKTKTDAKGLAYIKFATPMDEWKASGLAPFYSGFFALAAKGEDFSFTHSQWNQGLENWRFQLGVAEQWKSLLGHAILDRTLFKPEETLSTKIVLRTPSAQGFELPAEKEWPTTLQLEHESELQEFKLPLKWNKLNGTSLIKWQLPATIRYGSWNLYLLNGKSTKIHVGIFSVEAFRVPLIQLKLNASAPTFILEKSIPIQTTGHFFSGGPAVNLPIKMRWSVESDDFTPQNEDYQGFSFANGSIKEGVFRYGDEELSRHIPQSGQESYKLNEQGAAEVTLKNLKYGAGPQRLRTEVEFKDPSGEIKTVIRSYSMLPSSVILGIKSKSWWATPDLVEFDILALDSLQRPMVNQKVKVELYSNRNYTHRKRLVGGFYGYESFYEYKKLAELCQGKTDARGAIQCVGKTSHTGTVIAVVSTEDSKGRKSFANTTQWIVEKGNAQWFGSSDNDRVDLIPFKKSYEPGETAELQLRTPFPSSKVLVTVERESVLYSEVVDVKGDFPIIKIPIKKEFAPNVVVSAFAIRGRLNDPKPTALVDLGKPAFKLGMTNLKVGWQENTLKVAVSTDRKIYKARQKVKVRVAVQDIHGRPATSGDVALVAVDEGLLELKDNKSWNLLEAMMQMRSHDMSFATAQTFVLGKRHFGLKALPIGGDGGGLRRELFDTLLYWNPSVKLNAQGEAQVEMTLNDSTTSFRIVAIALQSTHQFGTGWTSIQSSQDLMILPGLSSVSREGDRFQAGFTIRNASAEKQEVELSLKTNPVLQAFAPQKVQLNPGASQEVFWSIVIPNIKESPRGDRIEYTVSAKNLQGKFLDEVKKSQKILPLRSARIYQSEWGSWPDFSRLSLQQPANSEIEKSSVVVELNQSLGGSGRGIADFWTNYPYSCLEQQVSQAVSLNDKRIWQKIMDKLPSYIDSQGLLSYFPNSDYGSVTLTALVFSLSNEAGLEIPPELKERLLSALKAFAEGRLKEKDEVVRPDLVLKKISALEALSRTTEFDKSLLSSIEYQGTQWPLYSLVEWYQIHQRIKDISGRDQKLKDIENFIHSRFIFSAKKLQLQNENQEMMPWLMRDSDTAVLRLVLAVLPLSSWKADVPRLYQGSLLRQRQGAWRLTTGNAWGSLMMRKFQSQFSSEKVEGQMLVELGSHKRTKNWKTGDEVLKALPWRGEKEIKWQQQGSGKPWITVSTKAAIKITKPTFAGFQFEKIITPIEQKKKGQWSVGDIAKVQLKVKSAAPQEWVAIDDHIPSGSSVLQNTAASSVERKEELIRFYLSWFKDEQVLEYTLRFNQAGNYVLPVSRVEAMYNPDIFAELPESSWIVVP